LKKYLFAIVLLALVVFASGCTTQGPTNQTTTMPTKTYNAGGISFNYPDTWNITSQSTENATIVTLTDPDFTKTNGTKGAGVMILKALKTSGVDMTQVRQQMLSSVQQSGANASATTATTINGINANETTITSTNAQGVQGQIRLIDFEKNNNIYLLMLITIGADIQSQKQNFDVILNSFKAE
jgi:PsbP-like protein